MVTSGSGGDRVAARGLSWPGAVAGKVRPSRARTSAHRRANPAKRDQADRGKLGDRGSARIGRGKRNERGRIFRWRASEDDEDPHGTQAACDGRLGEPGGRGDVADDLVKIVVVEIGELPGGIGGVGIRQRRQRNDERDDEQRETETDDSRRHWLIRYYLPGRPVNQ